MRGGSFATAPGVSFAFWVAAWSHGIFTSAFSVVICCILLVPFLLVGACAAVVIKVAGDAVRPAICDLVAVYDSLVWVGVGTGCGVGGVFTREILGHGILNEFADSLHSYRVGSRWCVLCFGDCGAVVLAMLR